jgi:hypothetical protein
MEEGEVPRPVYWKPRYPTRVMRERAFAKRQRARDEAFAHEQGPSLIKRLRELLRRGDGA